MSVQDHTTARRRSRPVLATAFHLGIVLLVLAGFAGLWWVKTLPGRIDDQQTIILGQTRFAPDSDASVRVVVRDLGAGKPIAGASVRVSLKPAAGQAIPLYEGVTDESGSLPVSFHIPADAPTEADLIVETQSPAGRDRLEQPVTIEREYRLLMTSDKPLYQPGQVIHMRVLALSTFDLSPARGATVDFLVEDAKGNKVFRHSVVLSEFGIAAVDFQLADMVNQGDYKLSAAIGDTRSEKTVEVRPYALPKFGVDVSTDRSFYLPGQRVDGTVQADYFFGKPVAFSEVHIVGSVWDVERSVAVDLVGQTDAAGTYAFSFDLPEYFAGSDLESGQAQFVLEVTVVDQTDHSEQISQVLPVAAQPLIIEAAAESGILKPGVENVLYVLTAYPDGRPAPASLQISVNGATPVSLESGELGLAQFVFTPDSDTDQWVSIVARDAAGLEAQRQFGLSVEHGYDIVLLRADRAAYLVGETMDLVVLTSVGAGSIYLDIVKVGQTLSTRSATVADGRAEFAVDVASDLYGTLELHAYKVLSDGSIVRDTRVVIVDAPNELVIDIAADSDTYLPGDIATIALETSDAAGGTGVQTALGLAIVDESVFALQRQDPGFAKLYFLLRKELMEPFYQVRGFQVPSLIYTAEEPATGDVLRQAQDGAAKAAWADFPVSVAGALNSRDDKMSAAYSAQNRGYELIGLLSSIGIIVGPIALFAVAIGTMWHSGLIKRSLGRLLVLIGVAAFLAVGAAGVLFVVERLFWVYIGAEELLIALGAVLGLVLFAFVVAAWIARDPAAKLLSSVTLAWVGLFVVLALASGEGGDPSSGLVVLAFLALLLVPLVYLLFGQARWLQKRRWVGGLGTCVGLSSSLPVLILVPLALASFASSRASITGLVTQGRGAEPWALEAAGDALNLDKSMIGGGGLMEAEAPSAEPMPASDEQAQTGEPPRLRQFFPETLYWAPEVVTDEGGFVSIDVPMADSITTWRLTALASSQDGRLGFATSGVRVFQDFFVDIDLPVSLTQGDEISIPVGVFNYLADAQEVRLVVEQEPWFELLGEGEQTLTIAANDIDVVYFPIRVLKFGRRSFQVTAWGEQMSDAIRREVSVVPSGKEIRLTDSDWLRESRDVAVSIPPEVVPETPGIEVKIYPGVMAQAVEGLEKILRLPHG